MRLDQAPDVVQMASELGVECHENAVANIIAFCRKKIARWVKAAGDVTTIKQLEELVCQRLQLVFEEVWCDADLDAIVRRYVASGDHVFATIRNTFDESTFATLIDRRRPDARDRYVAVIDCRGDKASRRFFTRWHEIAHLLTLVRQLEFPVHRSTIENPPLEQLMDAIAADIGFYDPIFVPIVKRAARSSQGLKFQDIERVRQEFCRDASFQATLYAVIKRYPRPLLCIDVGMGLKKGKCSRRVPGNGACFQRCAPPQKLRVLRVRGSDASRAAGFRIHKNMQVPDGSVIARRFHEGGFVGGRQRGGGRGF